MQDYEQMPARDRDDLILLRVSIDERRERLEADAVRKAERARKRGR
jgi:hypothetical protein